VEHPVTEEITGVDLVEWQLLVASGEVLPKRQGELSINGWAIEARLYAEDPNNGFLPSVGRLERFAHPQPPIRIETGVEQGDSVSPYYDPMIAKYVTHGATRDEAIFALADYLPFVQIWPVITNAGFLHRLLVDTAFVEGDVSTGFIGELSTDSFYENDPEQSDVDLAASVLVGSSEPQGLAGFRLNGSRFTKTWLTDRGNVYVSSNEPLASHVDEFSTIVVDGDVIFVTTLGRTWRFEAARSAGSAVGAAGDGTMLSPMPGRIIAVEVAAGDTVTKGQKLLTLEAMKMEHSLTAPFDGVVAELNAEAGAQVQVEALLVRIEAVE
jgi:3-methylcrotonyl-CoA carboxylase alpha subunit